MLLFFLAHPQIKIIKQRQALALIKVKTLIEPLIDKVKMKLKMNQLLILIYEVT